MELLIATRNPGKRREFAALLDGVFPEGVTFVDIGGWPTPLPEVVEDRDTFVGNAVKKAVETSQAAGVCALSEDSGLEVDALDGAPGVYSARFAGEDATDAENNAKLIASLGGVPAEARTARYRATICLAMIEGDALSAALLARLGVDPAAVTDGVPASPGEVGRVEDRLVAWWHGVVEGQIVLDARGDGGFGYDPYFLVPAWGETMAEVSPARKNSISHRARALAALAAALSPT